MSTGMEIGQGRPGPENGSGAKSGASGAKYRRAEYEDYRFIVDSWVDSYRSAHAAGLVPNCLHPDHPPRCNCWWYETMRPAVAWVLQRPGVETWVAYHPSAPVDCDLFGWLALERGTPVPMRKHSDEGRWQETMEPSDMPLLHYVFVKQPYRGFGIARGLVEASGLDLSKPFMYTCKTGIVTSLMGKHNYMGKWTPLLARYSRK